MYQVTIHEAEANLSQLIRRVLSGEEIIIAKGKKPLVRLVPVAKSKSARKIGADKGLIEIAHDFDAPLDEFKEYMP